MPAKFIIEPDRVVGQEKENLPKKVYASPLDGGRDVAREIADLIAERNREGRSTVIGLATGSSPLQVYRELIRIHKTESLSFQNVVTFNLDEYYPMEPTERRSYRHYMWVNLFDHVDIKKENVHIPDGRLSVDAIGASCAAFEEAIIAAGGLDFQLLGIGRSGHIGFNEPGSTIQSRTRLVTLVPVTRIDAAAEFGGLTFVPRRAITMGVSTILSARRVVIIAWGSAKADAVAALLEGPVTTACPASFLQTHPNTLLIADAPACSALTAAVTPWKVMDCDWGCEDIIRRAVLWLARTTNKPVLKLVSKDYRDHGLDQLLSSAQSAYAINMSVFNALQKTITGWPGGKPSQRAGQAIVESDATDGIDPCVTGRRPVVTATVAATAGGISPPSVAAGDHRKSVLVFSPHPDDDVISMGGTLLRLINQSHAVHVAYQTSGANAVAPHVLRKHIETACNPPFGNAEAARLLKAFVDAGVGTRQPMWPPSGDTEWDGSSGAIPSSVRTECREVAASIRQSEALAALRSGGMAQSDARAHFLRLPFYDKRADVTARHLRYTAADVTITHKLFMDLQPEIVFAAGDLLDPHGTHRIALEVITDALAIIADAAARGDAAAAWFNTTVVYLYRGAWEEWPLERISMAVPMSPDEVAAKRRCVLMHTSQLAVNTPFMGGDDREFWERAEARNRELADAYRKAGLAEYEAMEAFVAWDVRGAVARWVAGGGAVGGGDVAAGGNGMVDALLSGMV